MHTESPPASVLERKISAALKRRIARAARGEAPARVRNLNSILMKFPHVKVGYEKMRSAFRAVDVDESGSIDFAEWCDALSVGMNIDVAEDLRLALWREADVDGNDLIDFKEFTLVITLLYLLDFVEGEEAAATGGSAAEARDVEEEAIDVASSVRLQGKAIRVPAEVQSAIDIVVDAFLFFDADGDGRINKTEVIGGLDVNASDAKGKSMKGLKARSTKKGGRGEVAGVWRKRFKEMDCDNSGSISFREFILAFEDWAGVDENDEDEDDAYDDDE